MFGFAVNIIVDAIARAQAFDATRLRPITEQTRRPAVVVRRTSRATSIANAGLPAGAFPGADALNTASELAAHERSRAITRVGARSHSLALASHALGSARTVTAGEASDAGPQAAVAEGARGGAVGRGCAGRGRAARRAFGSAARTSTTGSRSAAARRTAGAASGSTNITAAALQQP